MEQTRKILIKDLSADVVDSDLDKDVLDIDFGGVMVQIKKRDNGSWGCANAVDGWGRNCALEFINEPVSVI